MKALSIMVQEYWSGLILFATVVKGDSQGHKGKYFGTNGKVLPQGIHIRDMKVISFKIYGLRVMIKVKLPHTDRQTDHKLDSSESLIPGS